jgi:hypothetical protein
MVNSSPRKKRSKTGTPLMNESDVCSASSTCAVLAKLATWLASTRKPKTSGFSLRLRRTGMNCMKVTDGW